jgi:3-deoxy-D-manno-octulosonic-acid transferase
LNYLYSLLYYLALPAVMLRLVWRGRNNRGYWQGWPERFGYPQPLRGNHPTVWIHAVSVGEVQAALPFIRALKERAQAPSVLVTTTTPTGAARVQQSFAGEVEHRYVPFDLPGAVARFLDRMDPYLAIIMETELWPNIIAQCRQRSIPVVLANVRLSERSAAGYRRFGKLAREMLAQVSAVAAQTSDDARRLVELGVPQERMRITGSVKFDLRLSASTREEGQAMRRRWGVERGVWVAASTHEGEEEQVLDAFSRVLRSVNDCLLVIVPRHPERFSKVAALCRKRGYHTVRRSEHPNSCNGVDVFVGDTMGELPVFYAGADVAFVGGSLTPIGGHNMLEAAALGIPVVMGPHVFNFAEISRRLYEVGAAREVADARALADAVVEWLRDANLRHSVGEKGRLFVRQNRGALERLVEMVIPFLERK